MAERPDTYLWYGDSGSGKTAQIGEAAKWEFARTGMITELISSDSGWFPVEDLVWREDKPFGTVTPSGPVCIQAWNIQYIKNPFPVLVKLSEGAWPRVTPDAKLSVSAPVKKDGRILACDGKHLIGQIAIEGLKTIADALMQDHIRNLRKIAQDIVGDFTDTVVVQTGAQSAPITEHFGKSAEAHYGQVQDFMLLDLVPRFGALPVHKVIWTSHEVVGKRKDKDTGIVQSVIGPALIGTATAQKTAMKFGDTFHFRVVNTAGKDQPVVNVFRAYWEKQPDSTFKTLYWPAKLSFPLSRMPEVAKLYPGGFFPLSLAKGITEFLDFKYGVQPGVSKSS